MINEPALQNSLIDLIKSYGDAGVFIAMLLESSIVPIPSEVIVVAASAIGISISAIVIFGSLGATIGAIIGYCIGRYAGLPVIERFGKYIFIKPEHFHKAQNFARKYGIAGVLFGRVVPVIPFKVFSIASGMTNVPFIPFVICTFIGVIPRLYLLSKFGVMLVKYTKPALLLLCVVIIAAVAGRVMYKKWRRL